MMRLDGYGLFVNDMALMIRFYRDVLGFEIKEAENTTNVYLVKDGTLFLLYGRKDFEALTGKNMNISKESMPIQKWHCMSIHLKKWMNNINMRYHMAHYP